MSCQAQNWQEQNLRILQDFLKLSRRKHPFTPLLQTAAADLEFPRALPRISLRSAFRFLPRCEGFGKSGKGGIAEKIQGGEGRFESLFQTALHLDDQQRV